MRRTVALAVVMLALGSLAGGPSRRQQEATRLLDALASGELNANQASNRLSVMGEDAFICSALVARLRRFTAAPSWYRPAIVVLGAVAVPNPDVEQVLSAAFNDEDITVRMAAIRGVARAKGTRAAPQLEALIGDRLLGVRREAAKALGVLGQSRSAAPLLAQARVEADPETRAFQLQALGHLGDKKVVPELEKFLAQSSESTRLAAGQSLCALGSPKGFAFAKALFASKDAFERTQGVRLFEGTPAKVSAPHLEPLLADADASVRATAARVLYQGGQKDKLSWLVLESTKANADQRTPYERELETLGLRDDERAAILAKAGLK